MVTECSKALITVLKFKLYALLLESINSEKYGRNHSYIKYICRYIDICSYKWSWNLIGKVNKYFRYDQQKTGFGTILKIIIYTVLGEWI